MGSRFRLDGIGSTPAVYDETARIEHADPDPRASSTARHTGKFSRREIETENR